MTAPIEGQKGRLEKALSPLGVLLILTGVAGLSSLLDARPAILTADTIITRTSLVIFCGLLILQGGTNLLAASRTLHPTHVRLAIVLTIATLAIAGFHPWTALLLELNHIDSIVWVFAVLGNLLMGSAAPLLWSSALVRFDRPESTRLQRMGRYSAGLIQLGLVFVFVNEAQYFNRFVLQHQFEARNAYEVLTLMASFPKMAMRVILLWASILSVRSASTLEEVRARATSIRLLMLIWIGLEILETMLRTAAEGVDYRLDSRGPAVIGQLWRHGVVVLAHLASTSLLATCFRADPIIPPVRPQEA